MKLKISQVNNLFVCYETISKQIIGKIGWDIGKAKNELKILIDGAWRNAYNNKLNELKINQDNKSDEERNAELENYLLQLQKDIFDNEVDINVYILKEEDVILLSDKFPVDTFDIIHNINNHG